MITKEGILLEGAFEYFIKNISKRHNNDSIKKVFKEQVPLLIKYRDSDGNNFAHLLQQHEFAKAGLNKIMRKFDALCELRKLRLLLITPNKDGELPLDVFVEKVRDDRAFEMLEELLYCDIDINFLLNYDKLKNSIKTKEGVLRVLEQLFVSSLDAFEDVRPAPSVLSHVSKRQYGRYRVGAHSHKRNKFAEFKVNINSVYEVAKDINYMPQIEGDFDPIEYMVLCFESEGRNDLIRRIVARVKRHSENALLNAVEELVKAGANINKLFLDVINIITIEREPVLGKKMGIIKKLIELGADINAISNDRRSFPLLEAVHRSNIEIVKILINNGANLELMNRDQNSALAQAAYNGNVEIAKLLIENGARVNGPDEQLACYKPLYIAAYNGETQIIRLLAKNNADLNIVSAAEQQLFGVESTPLIIAAKYGRLEAVKALVEEGADLDAHNQGIKAIKAARKGVSGETHTKIVEYLKKEVYKDSFLKYAYSVYEGYYDYARLMCNNYIDRAFVTIAAIAVLGFASSVAVGLLSGTLIYGVFAFDGISFAISEMAVMGIIVCYGRSLEQEIGY